jgi:putative membrane protein
MPFGHFPFSHGFGGPFGFHLLGAGLMTLFWLALLGLLVWTVLRLARGRPSRLAGAPWQGYAAPPQYNGPTATEILRQRYARGEIDADTYQQMLERLQASVPPAPGAAEWSNPSDRPML